MALGISITGILTIVVVVLALVVILLGIATRVKKLKVELKAREDDNITPYLRAISHYSKGSFDNDTKINALNKISKEFLRDLFKFNSEKTFEEIGELSQESDIKNFCNAMGVSRYSKNLGSKDIESMYSLFQSVLIKRLPKWVTESESAQEIQSSPISVDDLMNKKMKRDIADIKGELDKMSTVYQNQSPQVQQQAVSIKTNTVVLQSKAPQPKTIIQTSANSSSSSIKNISIDDRLSMLTEEIDKNASPILDNNSVNNDSQNNFVPQTKQTPQINNTSRVTSQKVFVQKKVVSLPQINPNRVINKLVKGSRVEKIKSFNQPLKVLHKKHFKSSSRLPLKTLKINTDDDNHLNREIESLSERLNRLVSDSAQKRLSSDEFY